MTMYPARKDIFITPARRKGLEAVRDGRVTREYRNKGNVLICSGVTARTLWELQHSKLIEDEIPERGEFALAPIRVRQGTVRMVLTEHGKDRLAELIAGE